MQYPRLVIPRIAVWRSPDDLHVGGCDSCLVLNAVPRQLAEVVECLDGRHEVNELYRIFDRQWVDWLLTVLDANSVLTEGPQKMALIPVQIHGSGDLADSITRLLQGIARPVSPAQSRSEVLHIVAADTVEADRVLLADLVCQRLRHLVVSASQDCASVGPFVIPGLTSCTICTDLTRRGLDPTWPIQVFQLARIPTAPSAVMCAWASATAVGHISAYSRGITPESASSTIELSATDSYLTYRNWPRHPECDCYRAG